MTTQRNFGTMGEIRKTARTTLKESVQWEYRNHSSMREPVTHIVSVGHAMRMVADDGAQSVYSIFPMARMDVDGETVAWTVEKEQELELLAAIDKHDDGAIAPHWQQLADNKALAADYGLNLACAEHERAEKSAYTQYREQCEARRARMVKAPFNRAQLRLARSPLAQYLDYAARLYRKPGKMALYAVRRFNYITLRAHFYGARDYNDYQQIRADVLGATRARAIMAARRESADRINF